MKCIKYFLVIVFILNVGFAKELVTQRSRNEIRIGPGNFYEILLLVPANTKLVISEEQGRWYKISSNSLKVINQNIDIKKAYWISKNCFINKNPTKKITDFRFDIKNTKPSKTSVAAAIRGMAIRFGKVSKNSINDFENYSQYITVPQHDFEKFNDEMRKHQRNLSKEFADLGLFMDEYETDLNEEALGLNISARVAEKGLLYNTRLYSYVNSITLYLSSLTNSYDKSISVYILKDDTVNAISVPGGKIFITTGLLKECSNESELAAVLAHELSHLFFRHGIKEMDERKNRIRIDESFEELDEMVDSQNNNSNEELEELTSEIIDRIYAPRLEKYEAEADKNAILLMYMAGYNVNGYISILEKFKSIFDSAESIENYNPYLRHNFTERIEFCEELIDDYEIATKESSFRIRFEDYLRELYK